MKFKSQCDPHSPALQNALSLRFSYHTPKFASLDLKTEYTHTPLNASKHLLEHPDHLLSSVCGVAARPTPGSTYTSFQRLTLRLLTSPENTEPLATAHPLIYVWVSVWPQWNHARRVQVNLLTLTHMKQACCEDQLLNTPSLSFMQYPTMSKKVCHPSSLIFLQDTTWPTGEFSCHPTTTSIFLFNICKLLKLPFTTIWKCLRVKAPPSQRSTINNPTIFNEPPQIHKKSNINKKN